MRPCIRQDLRTASGLSMQRDDPDGSLKHPPRVNARGYAEYYSENLRQDIIGGLEDNALKCKVNGGGIALGIESEPISASR